MECQVFQIWLWLEKNVFLFHLSTQFSKKFYKTIKNKFFLLVDPFFINGYRQIG